MSSQIHSRITGKARESLVRVLDHLLKDEGSLLATTRDYRGSVKGPNIYSLQRLFDEQRRQLDYWLGRVVERTKSIGLRRTTSAVSESGAAATRGTSMTARTMVGDL